MGGLSAIGIYRVSRLVIADPGGFAIFYNSHDPDTGVDVPFPSGKIVRGDAYVFHGGISTLRGDIPRKADLYVVVVSGYREESVRGVYGREVYVRGKITDIEVMEKTGGTREVMGRQLPTSKKTIVFINCVGLSPGDETDVDDVKKVLEDQIALLVAKNSELAKTNDSLTKEVNTLRENLKDAVSRYDTCRKAMDRLFQDLQSKIAEAEALIERLKTVSKVKEEGIKMIEKAVGEKGIFSRREEDENIKRIEEEIKKLKREAERV